jgi:type II secretory pathway pseudopilin PulG
LRSRSGFSFAEVMFAVVILGIGFILIAAVFPVATEQARETNDESIAAQMARDAAAIIRGSTISADFPDTASGAMQSFALNPTLWAKVSPSMINPSDARYAWVPFYSRNSGEGVIHLTILVVRRWMHDAYTTDDLTGDLQPRGINILSIKPTGDGASIVQIERDWLGQYQSVTEGSCLIIENGVGGGVPGTARCFHVSRYSSEDSQSVSYRLMPGEGLDPGESYDNPEAVVIGRDYADLSNPQAGFAGPAQDVAVYSTIMRPN